MTPREKVSFVSPRPSVFPDGAAKGNLEGRGEPKLTVSRGASL